MSKVMITLLSSMILSVWALGCEGDSPIDSSSELATDSGSGSGTLYVDGHVEAEVGHLTELHVEVHHDGQPVTDAQVRIESELGEALLSHSGSGSYHASQSGYADAYRLMVEAGSGNLEVTLEGPAPHDITSPAANSSYDTQQGDLQVTWTPTGAHTVRVKSDEADFDLEGDPGEAVILASYFEEDEDEIEVRRQNEIDPAGGVSGSHFKVSYETKTEIAIANPMDD